VWVTFIDIYIYLRVKCTKVWMYCIPVSNNHPSSLKHRGPLLSDESTDMVKEIARVVNFIRNLPIASSNIHIIPERSHQVARGEWELLVEPGIVCITK